MTTTAQNPTPAASGLELPEVERVAIALYTVDDCTSANTWNDLPEYGKDRFRDRARAAIDTMRRPSVSPDAFDLIGQLVSLAAMYDQPLAKSIGERLDKALSAQPAPVVGGDAWLLREALEHMRRAKEVLAHCGLRMDAGPGNWSHDFNACISRIEGATKSECAHGNSMLTVCDDCNKIIREAALSARPAVEGEPLLPVEIHGSIYNVPIGVHLHIVSLIDKLKSIGQTRYSHPVTQLLYATEHCLSAAEEGVDYCVGRPMLDALTTLGLMEKVGRGKWAPTDAAQGFVTMATANTPPAVEGGDRITPEQEAADWANDDGGSIMDPAAVEGGQFNCPICGYDRPHQHIGEEIARYRGAVDGGDRISLYAYGQAFQDAVKGNIEFPFSHQMLEAIRSRASEVQSRINRAPSPLPAAVEGAQYCDCAPMKCNGDWPTKACRFAIMREAGAEPQHPSVEGAQGASGEPQTLPQPTCVYLTDKGAIVIGSPQQGWDVETDAAHNCDTNGCGSAHVLYRLPFTDERTPPATGSGGEAT